MPSLRRVRYRSTRGDAGVCDFRTVVLSGLAPDGGLYVPVEIPELPRGWDSWSYAEAVTNALEIFGATGAAVLVEEAARSFAHPEIAPISEVGDRLVLELFWGPTLSFKDHALQVVTRLLDREVESGVIVVATSGDTGSAAIEACRGRDHLRIVVLFPDGMVSEFQRRQMTTVEDGNVRAVAVRGTFDDCQALVKHAFSAQPGLLALNSINWARIAAQVGYYIYAAAVIGEPFDVAVPTGNFGNAYSCWTAKRMGAPIETITVANNANHFLTDRVTGLDAGPAPVTATMAPAMDIQIPSNLERFDGELAAEFRAGWSNDEEIRETIRLVASDHGYILDPHTATAWRTGAETRSDRRQLVVATAHPSKFDQSIDPPDRFLRLFEMPERIEVIDPEPSALEPYVR